MKLFKRPMTWGGFMGLCGICFTIILMMIGYAFGIHKKIWEGMKKAKKNIFK